MPASWRVGKRSRAPVAGQFEFPLMLEPVTVEPNSGRAGTRLELGRFSDQLLILEVDLRS
jgi:hypothetical protein